MKIIQTTYFFRSSDGERLYQTQKYTDGTTSCDCPGWTRRCGPGNVRTCKHTRLVEAGLTSSAITTVTPPRGNRAAVATPINRPRKRAAATIDEATTRRLDLTND